MNSCNFSNIFIASVNEYIYRADVNRVRSYSLKEVHDANVQQENLYVSWFHHDVQSRGFINASLSKFGSDHQTTSAI